MICEAMRTFEFFAWYGFSRYIRIKVYKMINTIKHERAKLYSMNYLLKTVLDNEMNRQFTLF